VRSREVVKEAMVRVAYDAIKRGADGVTAVEKTFTGVPDLVAIEASFDAEFRIIEEWWQGVEATIDAEQVKAAFSMIPKI
jgi:hypothetical protein